MTGQCNQPAPTPAPQGNFKHFLLIQSFDHKSEDRIDFVALFFLGMEKDQFETWLMANRGRRLALEELQLDSERPLRGLVQSPLVSGAPHVFDRWRPSSAVGTEVKVELECSQLPRRRNFLHRGMLADRSIDIADEEGNGSSRSWADLPRSLGSFILEKDGLCFMSSHHAFPSHTVSATSSQW